MNSWLEVVGVILKLCVSGCNIHCLHSVMGLFWLFTYFVVNEGGWGVILGFIGVHNPSLDF